MRFVLCVGDDDGGDLVARSRTQPDDARECSADRFEVRVDGWRRCREHHAGELAAQWCTHQAAHLLGGEFGFGKEVAELRQGALPKKI